MALVVVSASPLAPGVTTAAGWRAALSEVTVLVVNYNSGPWLQRSIRALRRALPDQPRIVVVDNASSDGSAETVSEFDNVHRLPQTENLGFARGVNLAAQHATTPYVLVHNPDCLIAPDNLLRLIDLLERVPEAAMVSGRVFDMRGTEQRGSRRVLPTPRRILEEWLGRGPGLDYSDQPAPDQALAVEAVSGACMLIRRSAFEAVGGLDEGYPMHFEDLDLMARLRQAGHQIWLQPEVAISHAGGVSSSHHPVRVMRNKHIGLWRYLNRHCCQQWPRWSRPLWALALTAHVVVQVPIITWRHR